MAANTPKYAIDEVIYLRESAMLGFIESYKIDGIEFDNRIKQWIYKIQIRQRGPSPNTIIDRADLRHFEVLRFREDELMTFCDAIDIAISKAEERLSRLIAARASKCGDNTES